MIVRILLRSSLAFFLLFFDSAIARAQVNWTGAVSADWANGANWSGGTVPGATDMVQIGVTAFTVQPTISSNAQVKSLTFGGPVQVALTIQSGATLAVANKIVQNHAEGWQTPATTITGAGTLTCAGVVVGNPVSPRFVQNNTTTFISKIDSLKIIGNIDLNSITANLLTGGVANDNSLFSLQAGAVTLTGKINTANLMPVNCNDFGRNMPLASFRIDINSEKNALLRVIDTAAINITKITNGRVDLYNPKNGTGRGVVEYAGAGQLLYTNSLAGVDFSPANYQDLIITGSGNKTVGYGSGSGNQLNVNGNLVVNNATLDLKSFNPQTVVNGNVTNNGTINLGTGQTTINGTLYFTSGTFNIGTGEIHFTGSVP